MLRPLSRLKEQALSRWLLSITPFAAALFALAFALFLIQTALKENQTTSLALEQDLLWQKQALKNRLDNLTTQLNGLADVIATEGVASANFTGRSLSILQDSPEVMSLEYVDETGQERWRHPQYRPDFLPEQKHRNLVAARSAVLASTEAHFSSVILGKQNVPLVALVVPVRLSFNGRHTLLAMINLNTLLQQQVPWWIAQRYQITLDQNGQQVASKFDRNLDPTQLSKSIEFELAPNRFELKATVYQQKQSWQQHLLTLVVATLSILMIGSTWALRRHIKERQKVESQLRQETAMREAMENSLVTGIRAMDKEGHLIYINRAFCDMVGYSYEELIGKSQVMPYWPPEDLDRCMAVYRAILSGRAEAAGYQMRFMRANGERFDVRLYAAKLIDGEGQHTGWISSIYDITELQRERDALQASHERFVTVLNGLDAAVSVSDASSGEMLLTNRQFDRAFSIPDWHGRYCALPYVARRKGAPIDTEWLDVYRGHWYQVKSRSSVWVDGSEVWLEIATDITDLKNAQERERLQNEQLQQTTRLISMGEMASSLAHELNQPLAAIASYATGCRNVLSQAEPNIAQLDQAIEKMAAQAKRAGKIISGIREFVQRRAPHRKQCQIAELVDTVRTLLAAEVAKQQVKLTISDVSQLPPISADAVMLEQVMFNLMKNAIEAMHNTPVAERSLTLSITPSDDILSFVISDRGSGIAPEQMEQLFKPFFTTKNTGMGMGLNICRSIIEHHQGRLWVEANPGGGSRFIFTLPLPQDNLAYEP